MKLAELIDILEEIAPPGLADADDMARIGMIVRGRDEVDKAVVALDPTEKVLLHAVEASAGIVIVHHPLIFHPVNTIPPYLGRHLKPLLENDISLYAMHTNYDRTEGGINDVLASRIGLIDVENADMARIGTLSKRMELDEFAALVSEKLETDVQCAGEHDVQRVMVLGGSGFHRDVIDLALANNADVLVSAELRHDALRYSLASGLCVVDAGHYGTENPGMRALCERLPVEAEFVEDRPEVKVIGSGR